MHIILVYIYQFILKKTEGSKALLRCYQHHEQEPAMHTY
jgi:hypothetical protein